MSEKEIPLEVKYKRLQEIHTSTNEAVENLHKALNIAAAENRQLAVQIQSLQAGISQQQTIVSNHLMQSSNEKRQLEQEIAGLRSKIKAFRMEKGLKSDPGDED